MRGKKILLNNVINKNFIKRSQIIAIIGANRVVGTTHTSIMISNYLSSKGKRVAILELNDSGAFERIQLAYDEDCRRDTFRIRNVHYYKQVSEEQLINIINEDFDYFIMDIGYNYRFINEFLRADLQLVLALSSEWKKAEILEFYRTYNNQPGSDKWLYLFTFGQHFDVKHISNSLKIKGTSIPYNPDPYNLNTDTQKKIEKILNGGA